MPRYAALMAVLNLPELGIMLGYVCFSSLVPPLTHFGDSDGTNKAQPRNTHSNRSNLRETLFFSLSKVLFIPRIHRLPEANVIYPFLIIVILQYFAPQIWLKETKTLWSPERRNQLALELSTPTGFGASLFLQIIWHFGTLLSGCIMTPGVRGAAAALAVLGLDIQMGILALFWY